jgi:hypothetical protein
MRVNIYAEEITNRVQLVKKETGPDAAFIGLRFYMELPATVGGQQIRAPFIHGPGDDDSAAITFWGKRDLIPALERGLALLYQHYGIPSPQPFPVPNAFFPAADAFGMGDPPPAGP